MSDESDERDRQLAKQKYDAENRIGVLFWISVVIVILGITLALVLQGQ